MKAEGGGRKAADLVSILHFALCIFHFAFLLRVLRVLCGAVSQSGDSVGRLPCIVWRYHVTRPTTTLIGSQTQSSSARIAWLRRGSGQSKAISDTRGVPNSHNAPQTARKMGRFRHPESLRRARRGRR